MDVTAGFDGKAMPQSWVPVLVEFFNDGPPVEGFVEVASPAPARGPIYSKPVVLPTNSRKRVWLYPRVGAYVTQYNVQLVSSKGRVIAEASTQLQMIPANSFLLVSGTRSEMNLLPFSARGNQLNPIMTARELPVALPDDAVGLEGVHALVLSDATESEWTPGQRKALRDWVALGGHLVVSIDNADSFIKSRFWEELLPMRITGSEVAPNLDALKQLSVGATSVPRSECPVAIGELQRGVVRASTGNLPLVIDSTFGRGKVTLLTFNIAREPFRAWGSKEAFWRGLLELPVQESATHSSGNMVQWGGHTYDDVFRILLEARLEKYISLWWLIGLIGCYLVVIGPFDYWLVRHKLKRPVLTWITFPCYVIGFSTLIYGIGYALKSGDSELVQASFVDIVPEAKLTHGITISGFYSTSNRRYGFQGSVPESHFRLAASGMGDPSPGGSPLTGDTHIIETDQGYAVSLPVPIWSSKTFVTEWSGEDLPVEVKRTDVGGAVEVDLVNHLPVKLTKVCVVENGKVHTLADVSANGSVKHRLVSDSKQSIENWTIPLQTFLSRNLPMMGFGFRTIKPEDLPSWEQVLMGSCFVEKLNLPNQQFNVTPWRGIDLSQAMKNGDMILLAYVDDFPINGYQPKFKPDRIQHHALLRCVLQRTLNPEP